MDGLPEWFKWAARELGTRELPDNRGPAIRRYIQLAHCGNEGDPWCAIFTNAALEASGVRGSRSAMARSYVGDKANFIRLAGPAPGCIVVFWRGAMSSPYGHVGFYTGEVPGYVYCLGGNEGDAVRNERYPKSSAHFGLYGYYWPKSVPLPALIGPVKPFAAIGAVAGSGKVT